MVPRTLEKKLLTLAHLQREVDVRPAPALFDERTRKLLPLAAPRWSEDDSPEVSPMSGDKTVTDVRP